MKSTGVKHPAVLLTWRDSCSERGWNRMTDPESKTVSIITSVGWIVDETDGEITITTSITDHGSAMDPLTIPKECIVKRKRLPHHIQGQPNPPL